MSRRTVLLEAAFRLLILGWYIAIAIVGGVVLGVWIDDKIGLTPVFTLLGLIFGLLVAFVGSYRMAKPLLRRSINDKKRK
jgi:F0F1-type ATP synthase assembly protein I